MRHVTGLPRHRLILSLDGEMPEDMLHRFLGLVGRRASREPLQHLTGTVDFMGREFRAGPEALVPRPETETLVEIFMGRLRKHRNIVDVGTGSGVIGTTLALEHPTARVIGTDVSLQALGLAEANRRQHGAENMDLVGCDLLGAFGPGPVFDGIVANLPYVPSSAVDTLMPEVSLWDPREALDGGEDGLSLVYRLLEQAPPLLFQDGVLALELDPEQTGTVSQILEGSDMCSVEVHEDLTGTPRFVTARKRDGGI